MGYIRKPTVVEAHRITTGSSLVGFLRQGEMVEISMSSAVVNTPDGPQRAVIGEWVVREYGHLSIYTHEEFTAEFMPEERVHTCS